MPLLLLLFVDCCLPLPSSLPPPPMPPRSSRCCCRHDHHPPSKFIVVIFIILSFAAVTVIVGIAPVAIVNSLTAKSVLAGTKLILFGRYILNIYVGIVRYILRKTKTWRAKITYQHNTQIGKYRTILTSAKKI
jgi:hypothetical protein